jgi:hypothetical protein
MRAKWMLDRLATLEDYANDLRAIIDKLRKEDQLSRAEFVKAYPTSSGPCHVWQGGEVLTTEQTERKKEILVAHG